MSKFDILNKIKDDFAENFNSIGGYFKKTKEALNNFDDFLEDNKKFVLGLAGTSLLATAALVYDTYQSTRTVSLDMYSTSKVAQVKNRTDAMTTEFLKVPSELSQIKNKKYNQDDYEFNNDTHDYIKAQSSDNGTIFKNPFWPNNIVTVYNKPNEISKYHPEVLKNSPIDTSQHVIDMDYIEINKMAKEMNVDEDRKYLVENYVLYHESAHASYSQSMPYAGRTTTSIDNELMSDITSLIYIGNKSKANFDYMIDKVIKHRIEEVSKSGFSHNSVYGLVELKKAVQKNPLILDIKPENISQFSDMFVKELKSVNLSVYHESSLKDFKFPTREDILKDVYAGRDSDMYSSILYHQIKEGGENNMYNRSRLPTVKESFENLKQREIASQDILNRLKNHLAYDTLTSMVLKNSNSTDDALNKITDMVNSKPALKNDFIRAIAQGNLIYMDELKVNIEPVKKVEEESQKEKIKQIEQKNENELKRKVELQKPTMNNNAPT